MPRRRDDEMSAPANPDVTVRVVREFTHYPDGKQKQDETVGAEISVPADVADRWVKAGLVEYV